jgi:hypothetical protein
MNTQSVQLHVPLSFNQVVDIVRQLSPNDRKKLIEETIISDDLVISEKHKDIVRQRIKASEVNPERLLNWDEAKHKIRFKNAEKVRYRY